jgi:hypothetical protein
MIEDALERYLVVARSRVLSTRACRTRASSTPRVSEIAAGKTPPGWAHSE